MWKRRFGVTSAALLVGFGTAFFYMNARINQVEAASKPVATPFIQAVPQFQVMRNSVPGFLNPGVGNSNPVIIFGSVLQFDDNKDPHVQSPQSITMVADPFERYSFSVPFDATCGPSGTVTNAYECVLTPASPSTTWAGPGTLAARLSVTTANGDVLSGTINFPVL